MIILSFINTTSSVYSSFYLFFTLSIYYCQYKNNWLKLNSRFKQQTYGISIFTYFYFQIIVFYFHILNKYKF